MRFDWYQASVPVPPSVLEHSLIHVLDDSWGQGKSINGYENCLEGLETRVKLLFGGVNPDPFVIGSGGSAPAVADYLRSSFPKHRVSRADVALDTNEPGSFDAFASGIGSIARQTGVDINFHGDPDTTSRKGRTWYYGSKHSDVRICLYEKGLKAIKDGDSDADPNWVRCELRVRPRKQRKFSSATMMPEEFWGLSRWTQRVAEKVLSNVVPFVPDESIRRSELDKSFDHMLAQYRNVLFLYAEKYGEKAIHRRIARELEIAQAMAAAKDRDA